MLTTQVQYWTLMETKRHNLQSEDLGNRTLQENIRHNTVTENETNRHNVATENYYTNSLLETVRHNLVTEGQGQSKIEIDRMNAFTNQRNAATNEMNAATNRMAVGVQSYDAQTRRFSAITGASLGLDANRIAQENADSNRMSSEAKQTEAQTGQLRLFTVDQSNASSNAMNAEANQRNAATREGELQLGYDNLGLQEDWKQHQKTMDWFNFGEKTIDDVYDNMNETVRTGTNVLSTLKGVKSK